MRTRSRRPTSFQFTPLREGRRRWYAVSLIASVFQFTPLREGRRPSPRTPTSACGFQFTPLREGRLKAQTGDVQHVVISIHAPPRGATNGALTSATVSTISIHAPPRGATRKHSPPRCCRCIFQFTPLREGRPEAVGGAIANQNISIHAPPRGATYFQCSESIVSKFQFTPLREGRLYSSRYCSAILTNFNSRPSARGDRVRQVLGQQHHDFNSRPSARGDDFGCIANQHFVISIHAPPRGATELVACRNDVAVHFNSRPSARGDRMAKIVLFASQRISIHAPPRGATRSPARITWRKR